VQKFNSDSSRCEIYNAIDMHLNYLTLANYEDGKDNSMTIFPNPCSGAASIQVVADRKQVVSIDLFGIDGRMLCGIMKEEMLHGVHEIKFDVSDLPSGIYYLRMQAGDKVGGVKMVKME
jgi:hypothetical protein